MRDCNEKFHRSTNIQLKHVLFSTATVKKKSIVWLPVITMQFDHAVLLN